MYAISTMSSSVQGVFFLIAVACFVAAASSPAPLPAQTEPAAAAGAAAAAGLPSDDVVVARVNGEFVPFREYLPFLSGFRLPTGDLKEAAATLFAKLRLLDAGKLDGIVAESVPEEGLGIAIMDRLRKAAGNG